VYCCVRQLLAMSRLLLLLLLQLFRLVFNTRYLWMINRNFW
jgi:hypothetical protein